MDDGIFKHVKNPNVARFVLTTFLFQTLNLVFFAIFTEYDEATLDTSDDSVTHYYPFFQDVHVMMFVGFGYLLVFPSLHSLSAVVFNFMLSAIIFQWSLLTNGFWFQVGGGPFHRIALNLPSFINADFAVAAVLIAYSGVLGKLTPTQLLAMAFFETICFSLNLWLVTDVYCSVDIGGSMAIHAFGAYFGLAVSFVVDRNIPKDIIKKARASYHSDLFAMIGTLFLWMFWPSFNGALAHTGPQHRAVINTVLSLCGSCVTTFFTSILLRGKFDMVDIQNASLAGGVAVGTVADLAIGSWAAILIGSIAGGVSTWGYVVLTPFLESRFGLHDTAGIHNLHGMPGIIGSLAGIFASLHAPPEYYPKPGLEFPCRSSSNETLAAALGLKPGRDWDNVRQAQFQAASMFTSLGIALGAGIVTGFILRCPCFASPLDSFSREDYFGELFVHVGDDYGNHKKDDSMIDDTIVDIPQIKKKTTKKDSEKGNRPETKNRKQRRRQEEVSESNNNNNSDSDNNSSHIDKSSSNEESQSQQ